MPVRDALDDPRFVVVGDTHSINDGVVTALAQDDQGFLWIGTTVGLVRHDGYQLRPFPIGAPMGAPGTRPSVGGTRFVRALLAAPDGVLWAGLEGEGLARLDLASQRWTLFRPDPSRPGALAHGTVRALAREADGTLWVGTTGGGLHSLAPGAAEFVHHRRADGALPDDRVQSLRVDRQGTLWVGTWRGLVRKLRGSRRFEPVFSDAGGDTLAERQVSMLGEGPDGRIWVGTREGDLALITPSSGQGQWLERAPAATEAGVGPGGSASFVVANEREVWIGRDRGLDLRDAISGALQKRLQRSLNKPWGLAGHNVVALLRDDSGQIWIGSYGGGLQRHIPSAGLWVRRGEGPPGGAFEEGDVRSLHQLAHGEARGEIWAGTPAGALIVLDDQLRLRRQILPGGDGARQFAGGLVGAITQAADGTVWVGSDSGIYAFGSDHRLRQRHSSGIGRTRRLLAAADGSLWAGTQDGVYRLAPGGSRFERLLRSDGQPLTGNVNALVQDRDGSLWIGANAGLFRVPAGEQRLQPQAGAGKGAGGLLSQVVLGLLVDRQGRLWVDTSAGLHRRIGDAGQTPRFEAVSQDGTSFGANLLDDDQGRIWSHQNVYDPRDGRLQELGAADGVDIGTGWFRAHAALADGRLLFGGSTGVLVVEPAQLRPWTHQPAVVVSDLRIDGERRPLARLQPGLVLQPGERAFSIEFAALDFTQPERNRYRYRLEGHDADWVATGAEFRVAGYGNLAPGRYRLQVQGSNRVGTWSPRLLNVDVQVLPAWWQTWWARAAGLAAALAAVWALVRLRTRMLERRQALLEAMVRERTAEHEALSQELQRKSAALEASSLTDPLTGLHNRRFLSQHMAGDAALVMRRHSEAGGPLAATLPGGLGDGPDIVFFLIDIDHFKQVNDQHGHAAGDAVLLQVCERLKAAFREADYLVRWGGEEFLVAARATSRERAAELAERARLAIAREPFVLDDGTRLYKTCSVGFAAYPLAPELPGALDWTATVDLADAALYVVKRGGRDGWLGLLRAELPTGGEATAGATAAAAALRRAASAPLANWAADGGVQLLGSRGFAEVPQAHIAAPGSTLAPHTP